MATEVEQQHWYFARNRKKVGPVPWGQLRALAAGGHLRPGDMVLCAGASRWTQAAAVPGLFPPAPSVTEGASSLAAGPPEGMPTLAALPVAAVATISHVPSASVSATTLAPVYAVATALLPSLPGYVIVGELGRGGMGVVYQAEQVKLKRLVALKMVLGGAIAGAQQLERFRAEAVAVARLQHPNIVQIYEVGEHGGLPFFSLEYCAGGSLAQRLDGTPLPPREAVGLIETLARAMHAAHERQIVHRDLKPANVLLTADGVPKITDFGLAKKLDATEVLTQSGAAMGTPSYMAPEQALGKSRDLGPSADIYALGAIFYELLTGRPPFKGATAMDTMVQVTIDEPVPPSRLQPKVPPDLETICLKCLEKLASRRYATAQALADDLHRYLAGEPIQARPAGRVERGWKWARRRPALAGLLAVSALALLSILTGILYFTVQLGRERNAAIAEKGKAENERERAEKNEAEARRQEEKTKQQEQLTDKERQRAEAREADARRDLDKARRTLLTAQLWRVAGLLEHDPMEALALLEDRDACPPELRDFAWRYYRSLYTQWNPALLQGQRGHVGAVAVRRDGKILASAAVGADSSIKLWNLETRKAIATLREHKGDVNCVVFSPDGTLLASGGDDKTVKLWDVDKKQVLATLHKHSGPVNSLAFSPDGNWLVSSSMVYDPVANAKNTDSRYNKGELQLWNVAARKHDRLLYSTPDTGIETVAFAPDGKTVAIGTTQASDMRLIAVDTGKVNNNCRGGGWIYRVAFSPDGQTVAWASASQLVFLMDVAAKQPRLTLRGHQSDGNGLAWSPDGKTLATGSNDGIIKLWNTSTGKERLTLKKPGVIHGIEFTPDGNTLVIAQGNRIVLWDLVPRTSWATYPTYKGSRAVALSQDGKTLAAAAAGERILKLRNLASGKERTVDLDTGSGTTLAFAPSGSLLAVGVHGWKEPKNQTQKTPLPTGECQLWDTNDGGKGKVATLKTKTERAITAVAFTPDDGSLITGDTGGQVLLWDVTESEKTKEGVLLGSHVGAVSALTLSADGRTLATGGADSSIKLWDLAERRERTTLKGHRGPVTGLAFLDKGESLASTGHDRSVRIWDVAAGKVRFALPPQPNTIHSLAVSTDGNTLALACQDRTIKLWDLPSRQLRAVLLGHTREVNAVTFSHDGKLLISASAPFSHWFVVSGEVKIWKADEGQEKPPPQK